jgi:molecular chaperone GrpE
MKKPTIDSQQNKKLAELEEKLKRSLADYANLEKRIESHRQLYATLACTTIVSKMIEVLDDLYLAQEHLKDPGLKIALDKFLQILKSEGLEEIPAENQTFNPSLMDCVDVAEGPQDSVVSVKKKGYTLNGHCLRPAHVIVGRESKPESSVKNS